MRESSGLALSSRNRRLSPAAVDHAAEIYRALTSAPNAEFARMALTEKGFEVEYLEEHSGRRFVAAFLEGVRLMVLTSLWIWPEPP